MPKPNRRKKKRQAKPTRASVIRAALAKKGWKQCELAVAMCVSPPTVSRWLTGERVPDRDHVGKLCPLLDIAPELLL